jgi:heterodisulfide reductase subunit B
MSTRAVCEALGIELLEIDDWNCCGATAAYAVDRPLSLALPAINLAKAEMENLDILTPCSACFHFLARANEMLKEKPKLRSKINKALEPMGLEYNGNVEVRFPLDVIVNELGIDKVKEKLDKARVRSLAGLKVAPYYGCLFLKPPSICKFDNPENPQTLNKLIDAIGAESIPWREYKTRCCGGALQMIKEDAMLELSKRILQRAQEFEADCVLTACGFCHLNLDMKQGAINSEYDLDIKIPILYFTQFLGLALGLSPKELGLEKIKVSATKILEAITV